MADVQAGIGPFTRRLPCRRRGWQPDASIRHGDDARRHRRNAGDLAGPGARRCDASERPSSLRLVCMATLASLVLWVSHDFWMVAASQYFTAVTGAALGPAVAGVTLGMVRESRLRLRSGAIWWPTTRAMCRRGVVGLARLALRFRRGVCACGCVRRADGSIDAADSAPMSIDHDSARGLRRFRRHVVVFGTRAGEWFSHAVQVQAAAPARRRAGDVPSRQRSDASALWTGGGRRA